MTTWTVGMNLLTRTSENTPYSTDEPALREHIVKLASNGAVRRTYSPRSSANGSACVACLTTSSIFLAALAGAAPLLRCCFYRSSRRELDRFNQRFRQ